MLNTYHRFRQWALSWDDHKDTVWFTWSMHPNRLRVNSLRPSTHICVNKFTIIGSNGGLYPSRRQTIIWTNARILLIGPLGTNFSEILIAIQENAFESIVWHMASILSRPQCAPSLVTANEEWHSRREGNAPKIVTDGNSSCSLEYLATRWLALRRKWVKWPTYLRNFIAYTRTTRKQKDRGQKASGLQIYMI